MLPSGPVKTFAAEVAALVHSDHKREAALHVAEFCKIKVKIDGDDPKKYVPILAEWLHYLLNHEAPEEAAQLLWTPTRFTPEPQCTREVWQFFKESACGLIMGAASMSKSYGMGVRLFLEWIRDPDYTTVMVLGPTKSHLEKNLFSHIVSLHRDSTIPCPGDIGDLFIGADRRNQLGSITGVVIPLGQTKKAARLQGTKRQPRGKPHPIFGERSRMFIFCDEIERIPKGIWSDIDNVLTQIAAEGVDGFKIFGAFNPTDMTDEVATQAEPVFGWENLDGETHFRWKSKRDWDVLRLDGERSENVVQGREIYPGLQTRPGLEKIARKAGGRDSNGYRSQGRGLYPMQGIKTTLIPAGMWPKWRGEFIWYDEPRPVAACDLALEGGAQAVYTLGRFGKASGARLSPDLDNPRGSVVMFKDTLGQVRPRYALQVDSQHSLPRGDTCEMKDRLITLNRKAGVKPEYFAMDRTGNGAGTADLIKREWGPAIHDVNFSEGATKLKLMDEDTRTCEEEYDRMNSELWYALRAWGEHGYFRYSFALDTSELTPQIIQRLQKNSGKKSHVESKKDFCSRGFKSPDQADSLTLLVHAARMGSGVILSREGDAIGSDEGDGDWYDGGEQAVISACNRNDTLDGI